MSQVVASLMANIGANVEPFLKGSKKVKDELSDFNKALGFTSDKQARMFASVGAAVVSLGVMVGDAVKDQIAYANSVRELATVGDTSTEAASRFIQVLDDYKITAGEATLASKALKEKGMVPTIETLAKLSDAYLSIQDPAEKMKFIQENLGRGGVKWVEVLNKGSAAILKQNGAIDKSLILTQKMVDQARKAEIAQDSWNDAITGAKTSLAVGLLPALTSVINRFTVGYEAARIFYGALFDGEKGVVGYFEALDMANEAQEEQIRLMMESEGSIYENSGALQAQEEATREAENALNDYKDMLEEVSQANQDAESFMQSYADSQKQYAESHGDAIEKLADAQRDYFEALYEHGKGSEEVEKASEAVREQQNEVQKLEAQWHESTQAMIYDMALAKVSMDGFTDAEFAAMQKVAVEKGIRTQEQADQAIRMMEEANAIAAGVAADEAVMREQSKNDAILSELEKQAELEKTGQIAVAGADASAQAQAVFTGVVDSATLSIIRQGEAAAKTAALVASIKYPSSGGSADSVMHSKDSGGPGIAGTPYMIGTGAQPELFVPSTNGTFIPNADKKGLGGGTVYNIQITNPKPESSENSIRAALKNLNYIGSAA